MSHDDMDVDHLLKKLSASSRGIPSDGDFHFYYNFGEFKRPIEEIARRTQSMLSKIGSSENIWGRGAAFPVDIDDAYEWILNANDEVLELVDELVDELRKVKKEEEEEEWENGFESGCGKRIKSFDPEDEIELGDEIASNDKKSKVPFHIPTIRKPQYEYNIKADNENQPFQHVRLEKSDDGTRFIHPLEKLSVLDFVDKENLENLVPVKPPPVECTPFKLVEEVKGLKELAAKLRSVNEFAVDLEHNQYRSFQGLTCLMQISTRTEDFIVDTLKLRVHVGPYLREVFKDPSKKKVMHGADRDIVWLQRDFGIYVCNMFDTGQASRVLKLERFSLQYLLQHFCGVTANKEYQNADWRLRPLTNEMLRYGREDTHYLLYIYDLMRIKLSTLPKESESSDNPLLEVYKRSYNVCMKLYEKELLTENSYLHIYGLRGAGFNAQQLAAVSGLYEWRDILARSEDESPGYILPNKVIIEIAKQMPVVISNLRRLVSKSTLPYAERNLDIILNIVRHSMKNAAPFEEVALRLKEEHAARMANAVPVKDITEAPLPSLSSDLKEENFHHQDKNEQVKVETDSLDSEVPRGNNGANVQVLKTPTGAFDAAGNSVSERNFEPDKQGNEAIKLEQTRSSGILPSQSFLGNSEKSKQVVDTPSVASETSDLQKLVSGSASTSAPVGIIIDTDSDLEDMEQNNLENTNYLPEKKPVVSTSVKGDGDELTSLSQLSPTFKKCFQSNNRKNKSGQTEMNEESSGL